MQLPALDDTIVAVSSAWLAAPVGILRLSGPEAFVLAATLDCRLPAGDPDARPRCTRAMLRLPEVGTLPAHVLWFKGPRSYTGQDVVEIHTIGCLPVLRALSAQLLAAGARRAMAGEFTARAFVNRKLDTTQVAGVLDLMRAEHDADLRIAARHAGHAGHTLLAELRERLTGLLARIEANIDFVDEDDIRFVDADAVRQTLVAALDSVAASGLPTANDRRSGYPHVALVGVPNAGKSTLFNALLGTRRALVSPVLGTTRDVLSAEIEINGVPVVLQDCAGLGAAADELELATHVTAERTAEQADVVLWVHPAGAAWTDAVAKTCARIPAERRVLVVSKSDLVDAPLTEDGPSAYAERVSVSALANSGLDALRAAIVRVAERRAPPAARGFAQGVLEGVVPALHRAVAALAESAHRLDAPELVAFELRQACVLLSPNEQALDEQVLGRIYAEFCVGK